MDKFSLVYEFNQESPLMAYQASKAIDIQDYSKALKLLNSAIDKFPHYPTPFFLLALAHAHKGNYEKSREFLLKGHELLSEEHTFNYYSNEIEKIKRIAEGIPVDFEDTVKDVLNETFLEPEDFDQPPAMELLDDDFKQDDNTNIENYEQKSIVTETLAEIYASQGNFEEAIDIFEKLKEIKPDLTERFDNRIKELTEAIESKKQKKFGNK